MSRVSVEGCTVRAQAGITMGALALRLASEGLAGFEFASGIPGCLGGGIYMNAGAYNGEVGNLVKSVTLLNEQGELETLTREQMNFSYRHSAVTGRDVAVLEAVLELEKGDPAQIMAGIQDYSRRRRERQPLAYPSAGSMFKRPEGAYAAALIDQAHMKGVCVGAAQVSQKHAGFFINRGGATAKEMLPTCGICKAGGACGFGDHAPAGGAHFRRGFLTGFLAYKRKRRQPPLRKVV